MMDVFKLDHSLTHLGASPTEAGKLTAEVSFDTNSDFGLNFFEDVSTSPSSTQAIRREEFETAHCMFDPIFASKNVIREKKGAEKVEFVKFETIQNFSSECNSSSNSPSSTTVTLTSPVISISPEETDSSNPDIHTMVLNDATMLFDKPGPADLALPISIGSIKSECYPSSTDSNSQNCASGKSFIPCKVCGDKASGYHYGVTSCEGCKGFFRRSIQKQIEYRCLRDGKCLVIRLNRNRCQYCRFKKCLAVGMSRDSVRYGRVPKRNKEQVDESAAVQSADTEMTVPSDVSVSSVSVYEFINAVYQAHVANCVYTEEKLASIVAKPANFSVPSVSETIDGASSSMENVENQKLIIWQHMSVLMTPCIQRIVEFAKRVPGFQDLTQDDQLILIKMGFFEMWLAQVSKAFNSVEETLTFVEGTYFTKKELSIVFNPDFVCTVFQFTNSFNNINLNDTDTALFCAAILLTSDRPGLSNAKLIEGHHDRIMEILKFQVSKNDCGSCQMFSSLLIKLSELRNLSAKHSEHLPWFRLHWKKLKLPPLFAEIFDIPKNEEDLH